MCSGEPLDMAKHEELSESQREFLSAILDRPGTDGNAENSQCGVPAHLSAVHLLVSAMEGEGELQTEEGSKNVFEKKLKKVFLTF